MRTEKKKKEGKDIEVIVKGKLAMGKGESLMRCIDEHFSYCGGLRFVYWKWVDQMAYVGKKKDLNGLLANT